MEEGCGKGGAKSDSIPVSARIEFEALAATLAAARPSGTRVALGRALPPDGPPRLARGLSGGGIHERRRRQRREASQDRRPPARLDPGTAGGSDGRSPSGLAELEARLAVLHTQFWGSTVPHFGFSIFPALRTPGRGRRTSPGFRLECFRGLLDRLFPDSRIARSPSSGRSGFPCSPVSLLPSFASAGFAPLRHSGFSGFVLSCFRDFRTRPEDRPRIPAGDLSRSSGFPGCPLSILPGAPAFPVPRFPSCPVSRLPALRLYVIRALAVSVFPLPPLSRLRSLPVSGSLLTRISGNRAFGVAVTSVGVHGDHHLRSG